MPGPAPARCGGGRPPRRRRPLPPLRCSGRGDPRKGSQWLEGQTTPRGFTLAVRGGRLCNGQRKKGKVTYGRHPVVWVCAEYGPWAEARIGQQSSEPDCFFSFLLLVLMGGGSPGGKQAWLYGRGLGEVVCATGSD